VRRNDEWRDKTQWKNLIEESFEEIELFGKPALFTPDRNTYPKGFTFTRYGMTMNQGVIRYR
jgi:hypothetical protein